MNRLLPLCAAALVACSSDSVAVDPDAIDGAEKAAVQAALNVALKDDPLYPTLAFLVFPFIDRASHVTSSSYGTPTTTTYGTGLVLTASRGTLKGDFQFTGHPIPVPGPPDVSAAASFAGGIQALKLRITGTVP